MRTLLLSLFLAGCASKAAVPTRINLPKRAPVERVDLYKIPDDGICPAGKHFFMTRDDFIDLQLNVINSEIYIKQLENLLRSLGAK